jgi:CheY-like chemotaxis protein
VTPSTSSRVRAPLKVLICESNELSALKLRRLLELRGHAPAVVTLDEAIARIEADACDRLLIDAQLVPSTPLDTSVIALSSSSSPAAACQAVGIARCLAKPVLAAELWAALDD